MSTRWVDDTPMNKTTTLAASAIIAVAGFFLCSRLPISADTVAGLSTSVLVIGLMALEYGFSWKRLIGR